MEKRCLLIVLSSLFLLYSCDEKVACTEDVVKDIEKIESLFLELHKDGEVDEIQKNEFTKTLTRLSNLSQEEESCLVDNKVISPKSESLRLLSLLNPSSKGTRVTPEVVYGKDNRQDYSYVTNDLHKKLANSVAAHIDKNKILEDGTLSSSTIASSMNLCKSERFSEQINPARCSGFLVGDDLVVTAGHCVTGESDCQKYAWVFDFSDDIKKVDKEKSVYNCKEIISRELSSSTQMDYALIRLDRTVAGRTPLKFRTSGSIGTNADLVVIGHPSGLSVKVADGAKVRDNSNEVFFVANLDTFGGNSGSPVFDSNTGLVEGILVRGENDYTSSEEDGKYCRRVYTCLDDECRGEDVTRITNVEKLPVKSLPDEETIKISLLGGENKESVSSFLKLKTYSVDSYSISSESAFDSCVYHIFEQSKPSAWLEQTEGKCSSENLLQLAVDKFISLIQ